MTPKPLTLLVCHLDAGGPPFHPCRRAVAALDRSGVAYRREVAGRNRPLGLLTKGRRPEVKAISGQEKLPVLRLADGTTVNGSAAIVAWAQHRTSARDAALRKP